MKQLQKKWALLNKIYLLLFLVGKLNAQTFQNLVPNGSFETYTQCPNSANLIYSAVPWTGPRINSSDYNNACSTIMNVPHYAGVNHPYPYYLNAKDGSAYAGIYYYKPTDNDREYAQVKLIDSLINGVCYYAEFYAANTQGAPYGANNVGLNFSNTWYTNTTLVVNNSILNITQHITNFGNPILTDTVKWHKISGIYEATGIEKYLVIGNFSVNAKTDTVRIFRPVGLSPCAYMYIDAVSVFSINPNGTLPWSYRDTIINKGDSVFIGNKMGGLNFKPQWFTQSGIYIKTNAGITVSPTITSKYYVQYTLCGVQRTDTVKVTVLQPNQVALLKLKAVEEALKLFPNPTADLLNIDCEALNNEKLNCVLINGIGQAVLTSQIKFESGKAKMYVGTLAQGIYFLQLRGEARLLFKKIMIEK